MIAFTVRRLLQTVVVLLLVTVIAFSLLQVVPGDPALTMLGESATPEQVENLRRELGLDQPLPVQYLRWFGNMLKGDLGRSLALHESVSSLIASRLPVTLYFGVVALLVSVAVSLPLGIVSAVRRGTWVDSLVSFVANVSMAVPVFWFGILGIYLFSLKLGWLPVQGYTSPFDDFWLSTKHMVMPVAALALVPLASLARQTRSSMLEVVRQDFIRTARSKGLPERSVVSGHALKNALVPIITLLGIQLRNLVGGAVLVETVFNVPGMGRLIVSSVFAKDMPVVQGSVMVVALVVVLGNLVVDLCYGLVDPRIHYE